MEQFITEAGDLHLKLLTENGHRQRIAILCKALTSAYTLGKEAGMQEEAINCLDHCEKAKEEERERIRKEWGSIDFLNHHDDDNDHYWMRDKGSQEVMTMHITDFDRFDALLTNPKTEESYPFMNDPSRGGGGGH